MMIKKVMLIHSNIQTVFVVKVKGMIYNLNENKKSFSRRDMKKNLNAIL